MKNGARGSYAALISSGDKSLMMERLIITLTPSKAPLKNRAAIDSQKFLEKAKTSIHTPNPDTVL